MASEQSVSAPLVLFHSYPYLSALLVGAVTIYAYTAISSSKNIIKYLPSAGRGNWLTGHFPECFSYDPDIFSEECYRTLGPIHVIGGLFGTPRIVVQDPKALSHLVRNAYDYPKTNIIRGEIGRGIGHGLLWAEGDIHRKQRKMLNPAFSRPNVRELAPAFTSLALEFADRLDEAIDHDSDKPDSAVMDIYHWFFRVALDAIGQGGFGREYRSIHDEEQGLAKMFSLWSANEEQDFSFNSLIYRALSIILPPSVTSMPFVSGKRGVIVEMMKKAIHDDAVFMFNERKVHLEQGGHSDEEKKDLFTILMKGNMAATGKDKLSDDEVFSQIKTFLFAGHETTSTALSWTMYLLAQNPDIQDRLRTEVLKAKAEAEESGLNEISPEQLSALPLLDAVLREGLRLRSPVPGRSFVAQKDDVMPLSQPLKLTNGRVITELPVKKGTEFYTWHTVTHKREDVWGSDAAKFNPDRWLKDPDAGKAGDLKGASLYGQTMSFFGGPRSCIGYQFALVEMKALMAVILERFRFDDAGAPVSARTFIVMRPTVADKDGNLKNQMPLRLTRLKRNT